MIHGVVAEQPFANRVCFGRWQVQWLKIRMGPDTFVVKPVNSFEASELEDEVPCIARHRGRQHSALIPDDFLEEFPIIVKRLKVLGIPHALEISRRLWLTVGGEAAREDQPDEHTEREHARTLR